MRRFSRFYALDTPQGALKIDSYKTPHFVGHSSNRGMLLKNEDRYCLGFANLPINKTKRPVFNATIFDGHGGHDCAQFLQHNLGRYVERVNLNEKIHKKFEKEFGGYWRQRKSQQVIYSNEADDLEKRIPLAYLKADFDLLKDDKMSGSTCTSVFIYPLNEHEVYWDRDVVSNLVVAQIGDSRAVLSDNCGNCKRLTAVHHANSTSESDRLARFKSAFSSTPGGQRLFVQYVNTRAFGDHQAKHWGISAEPEITRYQLGSGMLKNEAFVVLVSDGVIDKASDQEICDLVIQQSVNGGALRGTPQLAANEVVSYVQMLRTVDNATVLVIRLGGWGDWRGWQDRSLELRQKKLKEASRRRED